MGAASKRSKKQIQEDKGNSEEERFFDSDDAYSDSGSDMVENEDGGEEEDDGNEGEEEEEGGGGGEAVGEEMEDLEKQYLSIRDEQNSLVQDLKRHKDDDALKGQAVKNQKALWDKSLEMRFLLQKAFSNSNKLPPEPTRSSFCDADESVKQAYSDLISSSEQTLNCLLELQESLTERNPSISDTAEGLSSDVDFQDDEDWVKVHRAQSRIAPFRNSSIDKWHRKTQVTSGAAALRGKLHAFNQNISEQVAGYMRDPSRMVKRMQLMRSSVGVFGDVPETTSTEEGANVDGDPELIDDSEFYQQLLKEFFESCDPNSTETMFYAMKKLQTKKRKVVDHRASKSRKIRYHVHDKIVNFMAPKPMHIPEMAPKLFTNLFGLRSQNSTPA